MARLEAYSKATFERAQKGDNVLQDVVPKKTLTYEEGVAILSSDNNVYQNTVVASHEPWVVLFHHLFMKDSQTYLPGFVRMASELKDLAKFGRLDQFEK